MSRNAYELERRSADVAARKSLHRRGRRVSPFGVVLVFGAIASGAFLVWAALVKDSSLAVLGGALVALATIYLLIAAFATVLTYRSGVDGHGFRAFLYAVIGGATAIVGFVALAIAYVTLNH